MRYCLIVGVALSLLLTPLIEARRCYSCDITDTGNCPGVQITCAEEDDCYVSRGAARGLPTVITMGCMEASYCGQEQQITSMGITYSLIAYCCHAELCNTGSQAQNETLIHVVDASATNLSAKLFLMVLFLFLL